MLARPASQQPWMIGDQLARGRPEDGHVVAGHQAARLQRGADDAGLVVDLAPRDERISRGRGDRRADEAHPGGPVGGGDDAIDDAHIRRLDALQT